MIYLLKTANGYYGVLKTHFEYDYVMKYHANSLLYKKSLTDVPLIVRQLRSISSEYIFDVKPLNVPEGLSENEAYVHYVISLKKKLGDKLINEPIDLSKYYHCKICKIYIVHLSKQRHLDGFQHMQTIQRASTTNHIG